MKTFKYFLLPFLFVLSSCYIYKPYEFKELKETTNGLGAQKSPSARLSSPTTPKGSFERSKPTDNMTEGDIEKMKLEELKNQSKENPNGMSLSRSQPVVDDSKQSLEAISIEKGSPSGNVDSLKIKIEPNKYYKITAEGKQYKIQADQWEGDTLVSHILRKPEKVLRFHSNQIEEEALMERRFSKPYSDLITVGAYVAGGAAVLLLVL